MKIHPQYLVSLAQAAEKGLLPNIARFEAFVNSGKLELVPEHKVQLQPAVNLTTPTLHEFIVPEGTTIDTAKIGLPMTDYCKTNLTESNFGGQVKVGPLRGGFIKMDRDYESEEGVEAVRLLAEQTKRKFRVGTALEFLLFKKQNCPHPQYCVALGSVWNGSVLYWSDWVDNRKFDLNDWAGEWSADSEVFFVEDL